MATMKDLKDQTGKPGPHPVLACACGCEFSANRADYFYLPDDHEFTCECGEPLDLVIVERTYRKVG